MGCMLPQCWEARKSWQATEEEVWHNQKAPFKGIVQQLSIRHA